MAPVNCNIKAKGKFTGKGGRDNPANKRHGGANKQKRKWVPEHNVFDGSVGEGQGFAFKRKQKVQHEYNKLLRKERRKTPGVQTQYKQDYPEHLKHLYMAEAEKLKNETRMNRINRTKGRQGGVLEAVTEDLGEETLPDQATPSDPVTSEDRTDSAPEPTKDLHADSLPMSNRQKKKMMKKTSYQKTKEEFEKIKERRSQKKEEFLKSKQQREEAIQKYKQKKTETFQMLSKKTRKGQPNLNLQMEYLLQKIQGSGK
ncbi:thyroid transcription factor 1-associated protein 26 homolog [Osmerus mordax]|uniref:thyroid transcription factor 1-associated protein 26 homolog n=1 Tax=Osmerus mordax TaxID=8014 RepID=UPI00350F14E1